MKVTVAVRGRFHAFHLARELARRGYLGRLVTSYPKLGTDRYEIPRERVRSLPVFEAAIRGWDRLPAPLRRPADLPFRVGDAFDRRAARELREGDDLFVGWSSTCLHGLRRARALGIRTVVERGSTHIEVQTELLREEYERWGVRGVLAHPKVVERELQEYAEADFVAIASSFVRRSFLERGFPEARLLVNPYGVDLQHFRPVPKRDDVFRVIHAGALSLRKGVHYLLQAFHELALPDAELWLLGRVEEEIRPFLAKYASDRVLLEGPYPELELYRHYGQGSVFCLASIEEGLSLVQAQAMACGLPVVCTENTGGEDLVREGRDGFVVPIRDVEALKERIRFLHDDPEAARARGDSARERVAAGLSWSDYGDRAVAAYARVLA